MGKLKFAMSLGIFVGNIVTHKYLLNSDWNEAIVTAIIATVLFAIGIYFLEFLLN
jgi:hypothetical protein